MPDTQDRGIPSEPVSEVRRRRRRHRRKPLLLRYWWLAPVVVLLYFVPSFLRWTMQPHFRPGPLVGYIGEPAKLEEEFLQYTGKPLLDNEAMQHFLQANERVQNGSYANAVLEMEMVSKQAAVPLVFNDLGVLYHNIHDREHAVRAFRDALARNHNYGPALASIKNLKLNISSDPGSAELESNNTARDANMIWLDKPMEGVIDARSADIDYYWFTAPRPPRDRIAVQVFSKSPTFTPQVSISESNGKGVIVREASGPGGNVRIDLAPAPNASYSLAVNGAGGTDGAYTLSVSSLRAYDVYEPNDDILSPTAISFGQQIDANIMDPDDTDYFSFIASKSGSVTVDLANHGPEMVLGLTTFAPDRSNTGFAPEGKPGASLRHTIPVEANQTYYLQVWAKSGTFGPYSMMLKDGAEQAAADSDKATDTVKSTLPARSKRKRK